MISFSFSILIILCDLISLAELSGINVLSGPEDRDFIIDTVNCLGAKQNYISAANFA